MTHKSNAKSRIAKAMLLLFTLSCAVGAAGLSASSRELSADYSTQAVVELSQMQAKNPDDGIQPLSGKADVTASYLNVRSARAHLTV